MTDNHCACSFSPLTFLPRLTFPRQRSLLLDLESMGILSSSGSSWNINNYITNMLYIYTRFGKTCNAGLSFALLLFLSFLVRTH
jgi:hypothetical protein